MSNTELVERVEAWLAWWKTEQRGDFPPTPEWQLLRDCLAALRGGAAAPPAHTPSTPAMRAKELLGITVRSSHTEYIEVSSAWHVAVCDFLRELSKETK